MKKIQPPGWEGPVTYPRYIWEELWMYGGRNGGYAQSSRLIGALKLLRACLPNIDIDRGEYASYYEFVLFSLPTRSCDEGELWALGAEFIRPKRGKTLIRWRRGVH